MALTLSPRRSLLGDLALTASSFMGGYGSGLGKNPPNSLVAQAMQGNQQAYQSAFNQSAQMFQQAAYQQRAHDNAISLQNNAAKNSLAALGPEVAAYADRSYLLNTGAPLLNDVGQPGTPGYLPSLRTQYEQSGASQRMPFTMFLQEQDNQRAQSAYKAKQEMLGLEFRPPDDPDTLAKVATLQSAMRDMTVENGWSPDLIATGRSRANAEIEQLLTPQWLPKKPKPQTVQERMQAGMIMPAPNGVDLVAVQPDGKTAVFRGTPPPRPAAGSAGKAGSFYDRVLGPPPVVGGAGGGGDGAPAGAPPAMAGPATRPAGVPAMAMPPTSQPSAPGENPAAMMRKLFSFEVEPGVDFILDQNGVGKHDTARADVRLRRQEMVGRDFESDIKIAMEAGFVEEFVAGEDGLGGKTIKKWDDEQFDRVYNKIREKRAQLMGGTVQAQQATRAGSLGQPDVGAIMGGYMFIGGDARDERSWRKVQ